MGTMDTTTKPYDNGTIPFVRPPRRHRREKRPLKWDAAADERNQRLKAMQDTEYAIRVWRSKGGPRTGQPKPKLEDFLPAHLKAADQPEGMMPIEPTPTQEELDEDAQLAATEDDDDTGSPATPQAVPDDQDDSGSPAMAPLSEDDSAVPGLGVVTKKAPKKAARAPKPASDDDTVPEIDIP
jgi:hypothetical protein